MLKCLIVHNHWILTLRFPRMTLQLSETNSYVKLSFISVNIYKNKLIYLFTLECYNKNTMQYKIITIKPLSSISTGINQIVKWFIV